MDDGNKIFHYNENTTNEKDDELGFSPDYTNSTFKDFTFNWALSDESDGFCYWKQNNKYYNGWRYIEKSGCAR